MPSTKTLTSPVPKKKQQVELSFYDAIREIMEGKRVARLEWPNKADYCLLQDTFLTIFIKGEFHQWSINDGDVEGIDWVVLPE